MLETGWLAGQKLRVSKTRGLTVEKKITYISMANVIDVVNNVTFLSNKNDTSICNEVQNTIVEGINVHIHVMSANADVAIGVASTIGFLFSVFLLLSGGRYFKMFASILTALISFWGINYLFSQTTNDMSCEMEFVIAGIGSLLAAISVSFLIKCALFSIGALFFGAASHFLMDAFPELQKLGDTPEVLGKSLVYYGVILVCGILGGFAIRCRETESLEILTSILGGIMFSLCCMGYVLILSWSIDRFAYVGVTFVTTLFGIYFQRKMRIKRRKKKDRKDNKDSDK